MKNKINKKSAFSLIELIIVMAIIVILTAIMLPAFSGYRNNAISSKGISEGKTVLDAYESYCAINGESPDYTKTISDVLSNQDVKDIIGDKNTDHDYNGIEGMQLNQIKDVIAGKEKFTVANGKIAGVK